MDKSRRLCFVQAVSKLAILPAAWAKAQIKTLKTAS